MSDRPGGLPDRDGPSAEAVSFEVSDALGNDAAHVAVYERYCRAAARIGFRIEIRSPEAMSERASGGTDIGGRCNLLNADLSPLERVMTLGHELAQVFATRSGRLLTDQPDLVHRHGQEIAAELVSQIVSRGLGSGEVPERIMLSAMEGLDAIGREPIAARKGRELIMFAHALLVAVEAGGALVACLLEDPEPLELESARRARQRRENPR